MDGQSLTNVLGLLRILREQKQANIPVSQFIANLADRDLSPQSTLQIAAYLIEQIEHATLVIHSSHLSDEAKGGVLQVLNQLKTTFSLGSMQGHISPIVQSAPGAISSFVILLGAYSIPENGSVPAEASDLMKDIEQAISAFNDPEIDPSVREIAQRHMRILLSLIKNIPILGLEPALTEYFSLVMKIRRTDIGASEISGEKIKPIWDKVKTWGDRLGSLDKIWNAGAKLLEHSDKAVGLLDHFTDVAG